MTCKHQNTTVVDTSPKNSKHKGKRRVGYTDKYDYYVMRRRKCFDCGESFTTVEVDRYLFEQVMDAIPNARATLLEEIKSFLDGI